MKQKSFLLSMLSMMMVALLSVGLTACGDDDDDNGGNNAVGTWYGEAGSYYYDEELTLTFNNNGTGTYVYVYSDSYDDDTDRGTFTYKMTGENSGIATVRIADSYADYPIDIPFSISGNTMYITVDGTPFTLRKR